MSEIAHSQRAHALLSASGSSRWIACPPSARLEEGYPDSSGDFAKEGTLAHELAEVMLRNRVGNIDAHEAIAKVAEIEKSEYYSDDMPEEVEKYVDLVLEEFAEAKSLTPDAILLLEERIDLTDFIPNGFGSNDAVIIADDVMSVIDLKYGRGVRVSAVDNSQLKLYGVGALMKYSVMYDIKKVRLIISQPRLDSVSIWEISSEDLLRWAEEVVKPAALTATKGEGELKAGDHCKFCKAKARCTALRDLALETAKHEFKDPNVLEEAELLDMYRKADLITDWLSAVQKYMLAEACKGKEWEGLKVVEGRTQRRISDTEGVQATLSEKGYKDTDFMESKLVALGKLEKLIGKKDFEPTLGKFVVKPKGQPTLVGLDDKRPPFDFGASSDFDDGFRDE